MKSYQVILQPKTAFATPLVGDTLFGQLCWALLELFGEERLEQCLEGYQNQTPFLVVSDAFLVDYFLLPTLPSFYWNNDGAIDRKILKGQRWIGETLLESKLSPDWQQHAKADSSIAKGELSLNATQMHNTLNRESGSTGTGTFAPFESALTWFNSNLKWQLRILLDESKLSTQELFKMLEHVGFMGYGKDATTGLGKFLINTLEEKPLPELKGSYNAYMTLANCAPMQEGFREDKSFYLTTTRFGRHGNHLATSGTPFKKPLLMAETGAIFAPEIFSPKLFIGQGLSNISTHEKTVHQGYAPVIGVEIDYQRFEHL